VAVSRAAVLLAISPEAVRKRIRRSSLQAYKRDGVWAVVLPAAQDGGTSRGQDAARDAVQDGVQAGLVVQLQSEVAYLCRQLEEAAVERAELRRMLNLEQQTVAALRSPPPLWTPSPRARRAPRTTRRPPRG
jgi:hypothetical protein